MGKALSVFSKEVPLEQARPIRGLRAVFGEVLLTMHLPPIMIPHMCLACSYKTAVLLTDQSVPYHTAISGSLLSVTTTSVSSECSQASSWGAKDGQSPLLAHNQSFFSTPSTLIAS